MSGSLPAAFRILDASPSESKAIESILVSAFASAPHSSGNEHLIFRRLLERNALSVSLVARDADGPIGYVGCSRVTISDGTSNWHGLGPLAVSPAFQRNGVGRCNPLVYPDHLEVEG